jgi:pimeloyl-ACP methyl ester carboxylesterase
MPHRWLFLATILWLAVGCTGNVAYRAGDQSHETAHVDGTRCNGLTTAADIPVGYVEIDEQGYFQDRPQVAAALALVEPDPRPIYVVVFVHGWFHDASPDDENVALFKCALGRLQGIAGGDKERVVGIYIGWRGKSLYVPGLQFTTFWDRKNTSEEVGRGSLVEFLIRLEAATKPDPASQNKLMLVGHSFGASVVFNSLGQIMLARFLLDAERLASGRGPRHAQSKPGLVTGYGDLVVLVNPAIEATRIWPFFSSLNDYTVRYPNLLSLAQPPRLVILSSEGDWATRRVFPAARVFSTMLESYRPVRQPTPYGVIEFSERHFDWQTMGNVGELLTHDRLARASKENWPGQCPGLKDGWLEAAIEARQSEQRQAGLPATGAGWSMLFGDTGISLRHQGITTPSNPLWIMPVGTELIPDHSDISNPVMICLFDQLLGDPARTNAAGKRHEGKSSK